MLHLLTSLYERFSLFSLSSISLSGLCLSKCDTGESSDLYVSKQIDVFFVQRRVLFKQTQDFLNKIDFLNKADGSSMLK